MNNLPELSYLVNTSERLKNNLQLLHDAERKRNIRQSTLDKYKLVEANLATSLSLLNEMISPTSTDEIEMSQDLVNMETSSSMKDTSLSRSQIVSGYAKMLPNAANAEYCDPLITLLANALSEWFNVKYLHRKENFFYSAQQIPEWIDSIILAFSEAFLSNQHFQFVANLSEWVSTSDSTYPAPPSIRSISEASEYSIACQLYGCAFEKEIKSVLYSSTFLPEYKNSIYQIVKECNSFIQIPDTYTEITSLADMYNITRKEA